MIPLSFLCAMMISWLVCSFLLFKITVIYLELTDEFYCLRFSFSWTWQKVAGDGVGLLLNRAGRHHTHCHLMIRIFLQTSAQRNAPKFRTRKTGKMLLVLFAWSARTMLFFSSVPHMIKVAVPTCVELAFDIPIALTSTRKLMRKLTQPLVRLKIQFWCQIPAGLLRIVKLLSLLAPSAGVR